jgi:nitroreductase
LDAAVHAPTAIHEEPWAFAIIQDKALLKRLSDDVKVLLVSGADPIHPLLRGHGAGRFTSPEFNAFYNAGTLVVIYGKPLGPFVVADCWLAAENPMLAAFANGLATCPIGLAVAAVNTPQWKRELGVPTEMTAIAPIIWDCLLAKHRPYLASRRKFFPGNRVRGETILTPCLKCTV